MQFLEFLTEIATPSLVLSPIASSSSFSHMQSPICDHFIVWHAEAHDFYILPSVTPGNVFFVALAYATFGLFPGIEKLDGMQFPHALHKI